MKNWKRKSTYPHRFPSSISEKSAFPKARKRKLKPFVLWLSLLFLAIVAAIVMAFSFSGKSKNKFKNSSEEAQKPQNTISVVTPPASASKQLEGITANESPSGEKVIALTFNDGPHASYTQRILDALEANDVVATFFVVGNRVELFPDLIKKAYEQGNEIGSLGYNQKDLSLLGIETARKELDSSSALIENVLGVAPNFVRPPGGNMNEELAAKLGRQMVLWTLDSGDNNSRDAQEIADIVVNNVEDRSIILMHDRYKSSAEALELILPRLKQQGYRFVTVSELIDMQKEDGVIVRRVYPSPER